MELWVCEYSPLQGCFNIDTIDRVLSKNRRALTEGKHPGYIPLWVGLSVQEAHTFAEQWECEHER